MIAREWQIGIFGTFDLENYGDLLFPLIAEAELRERLGAVKLHRFSYHTKAPPEWPYEVTSLAELPERLSGLDAVLIGGGFLIRFDRDVAPGYRPPTPAIHHPTGYWLTPALLAQQHDIPVIWNAPGMHLNPIPTWAAPLLERALALSAHIAVRDRPTQAALARLVDAQRITVTPDTGFGIGRISDGADAEALRALRAQHGLAGRYVVIQAAVGSRPFFRFLERHAQRLAGLRFLVLPIGPALGDDARLAGDFPGIVRLPVWPHPLLLAQLIGQAEAVLGHSYHLAITALAAGVPVFTWLELTAGKYTALQGFERIHRWAKSGEPDPEWFLARLGRGAPCAAALAACGALKDHWDRVAAIIAAGPTRTAPALDRWWQALPGLLEGSGVADHEASALRVAVLAAKVQRRVRRVLAALAARHLPWAITAYHAELRRPGLDPEDPTEVTVYHDRFVPAEEWTRSTPLSAPRQARANVSLVAVLRDGSGDHSAWLQAIAGQTRAPEELILVDSRTAPSLLRAIRLPGASRARAFRAGAAAARFAIVACIDSRHSPDARWLERLVSPFEIDPDTVVSVGSIASDGPAPAPRALLPSLASVALRREAAVSEREWIAENDLIVSLALERRPGAWAYVPEAEVRLTHDRDLAAAYRQASSSGQAAIFPSRGGAGVPLLTRAATVVGYLDGVRRRPAAIGHALGDDAATILVLSLVPISDSGGGQRPAQLAHELARRGHLVLYLNHWSTDAPDTRVAMGSIRLHTFPAAGFDVAAALARYRASSRGPTVAIVEAPTAEFLRIARGVRAVGGTVVYDLIDDWSTSLGVGFYSPEVERELIASSDVLVATAEVLRRQLARSSGGRPVAMLGNAVNTTLFDRRRVHPRPSDLPTGGPVLTYVGALWGEWFDWELLTDIARGYPDARVVLIGDYRGGCPDPPANVFFLGLRQQRLVPAYLAHTNVAIIPWNKSVITDATSPLKLYEYLAMGKPVVAPALDELAGMPNVLLSRDRREFVEHIARAQMLRVDDAALDAFIAANGWTERVGVLLALIDAAQRRTRQLV